MGAKRQLSILHINGLFHIFKTCAVPVFDVFDIDAIKAKLRFAVLLAIKPCANNKFRTLVNLPQRIAQQICEHGETAATQSLAVHE